MAHELSLFVRFKFQSTCIVKEMPKRSEHSMANFIKINQNISFTSFEIMTELRARYLSPECGWELMTSYHHG